MIRPDALVLGIETSCDETAVAVVRGGTEVLSNVIGAQAELHAPFGGVVPEVAARAHDKQIPAIVHTALQDAGIRAAQIEGVAATRGPGLIGALLVGYCYGKAMSGVLDVPFIGVHHIEGHILAARLSEERTDPPYVAMIVSGGHTSLIAVREDGIREVLGQTVDDAAGEAFDKVARLLGLGYPGGPQIDRLAISGDPEAVKFPRAMPNSLDFSYSGLKTAVVRYLRGDEIAPDADVAASFQEAVVDSLISKAFRACEAEKTRTLVVGGGVAANSRLRIRLFEEAEARNVNVIVPERALCVDNGAMIAAAGHLRLERGETTPFDAPASASLTLPLSG